jgi:hypothetical protein
MNVPILRKTIRLSNLATATIPVGPVLPFDERGVDFSTALRLFQCRLDLLFRAEHTPVINLDHSTFHSCFMHRRIHQIFARLVSRAFRTSTFAGAFRSAFDTERFQNRLLIRLVFIARNQSRSPVFQAFGRVVHQQLRVLFRSFAVDHFQHEPMFRINCNMIPIVATAGISRIVFVAMLFLFVNKVPLLVELEFLRLGGKPPRVRREVAPHVHRQVACNESRFASAFFPTDWSSSYRSPRRHAQGGRRLCPSAVVSRKKQFPDAPRIFPYRPDNTANAFSFRDRTKHGLGYFLHPEPRVEDSLYSGNKTFPNRPWRHS